MRNTFIVIGVLLVFFAVGIWFYLTKLDSKAKSEIEQHGSDMTKVAVHLGEVNISHKTGEGKIRDLMIGNPEAFTTPYAFSLPNTDINIDTQSLTTPVLIIHQLTVTMPEVNIEQNATGNNIHTISENVKAFISAHTEDVNHPSKRFIIDNLIIQNAKLHVSAPQVQPEVVTIPLADIRLTDVGKTNGGITSAELVSVIMQQINNQIVEAIRSRGLENMIDIKLLNPTAGENNSFGDRIIDFFSR